MKQKIFALMCVLWLCVPVFSFSDSTEIPYSCDSCGEQDICDTVDTRQEVQGEAIMQYYNVVCRHCGTPIFEGARQIGTVTASEPEPQAVSPDPPVYNPPPAEVQADPPAVEVQPDPPAQSQSQNPQPAGQEEPVADSPVAEVQPELPAQSQPQNPQPSEPEKPVTESRSVDENAGSSGSSNSPAVAVQQNSPAAVVQPELPAQAQPMSQNSQPAEPDKPVTLSSATDDNSESSGGNPSAAVSVQSESPVTMAGSQSQAQSQNTQPAEPEKPVTLPSSTGGSSESAGSNASAAAVVRVVPQQASAEDLPPVVLNHESSVQSAPSDVEESAGGQLRMISEKPDSEASAPETAGGAESYTLPKKRTRNYQKYPVFSIVYPSRRLNMPGDPDVWANIPGEKIYPVSGSSLLTDMLNGGN